MSQSSSPGAELKLEALLREKTAVVGVVGLGYVGLPLAQAFAAAGFRTLGFDVDPAKLNRIGASRAQAGGDPGDAGVRRGALEATGDMRRLGEADAIVICVPTPLTADREPDLTQIESATREIAARLRPGQLIVLESTTYPGTTRDVVAPILLGSGLRLGADFFLAYCPERHDPGNQRHDTRNTPKVVGGADPASQRVAEALYRDVAPRLVPVASCELAEACKILENVYRAVNIALVNELKTAFDRMGIDIWQAIDAAATKPFGFQAFYPGPGPGGHCIPIDPHYLTWIVRQHGGQTPLIELAGEINAAMPGYVVERLISALEARGRARGAPRSRCWAWLIRRMSTTIARARALRSLSGWPRRGRSLVTTIPSCRGWCSRARRIFRLCKARRSRRNI